MIRNITLGQYYQTESVLHGLDPRLKIIGTFLYIISLFLVRDIFGYAVAGIFLAVLIVLSHVPFKFMVRGLKGILVLLIVPYSRGGAHIRMEVQYNEGGPKGRQQDGHKAYFPCDRFIGHDADHNSQPSDRWAGESP